MITCIEPAQIIVQPSGGFNCGAADQNLKDVIWTPTSIMGCTQGDLLAAVCANWKLTVSPNGNPCSIPVERGWTGQLCNPNASAYNITLTVPWTANGNAGQAPPLPFQVTLQINSSQQNATGDASTATPSPLVCVVSLPPRQVSTVNIFLLADFLPDGVTGYDIDPLGVLTLTPLNHP